MMRAKENAAGPGRRIWIPLFAALALVLASNLPGISNHARATDSDVVIIEPNRCVPQFQRSPAFGECTSYNAAVSGSSDCAVTATCPYTSATGESLSSESSITVSYDDTDDLKNCSGTLALSC